MSRRPAEDTYPITPDYIPSPGDMIYVRRDGALEGRFILATDMGMTSRDEQQSRARSEIATTQGTKRKRATPSATPALAEEHGGLTLTAACAEDGKGARKQQARARLFLISEIPDATMRSFYQVSAHFVRVAGKGTGLP